MRGAKKEKEKKRVPNKDLKSKEERNQIKLNNI